MFAREHHRPTSPDRAPHPAAGPCPGDQVLGARGHVGEEEDAQHRLHHVVAVVRPGGRIGHMRAYLRQCRSVTGEFSDQRRREVHRVDVAARPDRAGRGQRRRTRAATRIQHPLAGPGRGGRHRRGPDGVPQMDAEAIEIASGGVECTGEPIVLSHALMVMVFNSFRRDSRSGQAVTARTAAKPKATAITATSSTARRREAAASIRWSAARRTQSRRHHQPRASRTASRVALASRMRP